MKWDTALTLGAIALSLLSLYHNRKTMRSLDEYERYLRNRKRNGTAL